MGNFFLYMQSSLVSLVVITSLMGGLTFLAHSFFLNKYLRSQNTFLTSLMLPTIALVITKAIAMNFYLSLGLIGALSIIRYRTPVKSMYELALLFFLVTLGVVGGVNIKWAIGLFFFISLIAPLFSIFLKFFPGFFTQTQHKDKVSLILKMEGEIDDLTDSINHNKGELISINQSVVDSKDVTTIVLAFGNMKEAIEAQSVFKKSNKFLSLSIS